MMHTGSYGRHSAERAEDRGDADIARSKDSDRLLSHRANRGDVVGSIPRRKESRRGSIRQMFHRSKAAHVKTDKSSIACSTKPNTAVQTDRKEVEQGFDGSVTKRRSRQSTSMMNIHPSRQNTAYIEDMISAQRSHSVEEDGKMQASLSSVSARESSYRKSSDRGSTTMRRESTKIHKSSRSIQSSHSSKKKQLSVSSSKRKKLQESEDEYWSGLSVRVAMTVMKANGNENMAQKLSTTVLAEGRKNRGQERSSKMIRSLSAKLSVAALEAGGDLGLAVLNAVTTYDKNYIGAKSAESTLIDDSSIEKKGSAAPSITPSIRSNKSKASSISPSVTSKRSKLRNIEMQILEKTKAIEEAELRNQEREREFNKRMAALEAATNERLAALDATKEALLEEAASSKASSTKASSSKTSSIRMRSMRAGSTQADEQYRQAHESKTTGADELDDNGTEKSSAIQSGIDDFVLSFNEQMAALEMAAKESWAGLDATKDALLEKAGLTQTERQDNVAAAIARWNENKDVKQEDIGNVKASTFQSGIDDFVSSFSEQLGMFKPPAKECSPGYDAIKSDLLEKAGPTRAEKQDVIALDSRNDNEDVRNDENGNESVSAMQMLTNRLFQSFEYSVGKTQEKIPPDNTSTSNQNDDDEHDDTLWEV